MHRRNEERGKKKKGLFWGIVFHENTSSKSKFRSKGAELLNYAYASMSPVETVEVVR